MSKKSAKKRAPQVPKIAPEVSEAIYNLRKGRGKLKRMQRQWAKLVKEGKVRLAPNAMEAPEKETPEEEGESEEISNNESVQTP